MRTDPRALVSAVQLHADTQRGLLERQMDAPANPMLPILLALAAAVAGFAAAWFVLRAAARRKAALRAKAESEAAAARAAAQAPTAGDRAVQLQRGLLKLHALNEIIPDPVLSGHILRMEQAGASLLEQARRDPALWPRLAAFCDYYLPEAAAILTRYADSLRDAGRSENARAMQQLVEKNAGIIATAFEKQLDQLYGDRATDTDVDIQVLRQMANRDGLQ